MGKVLVADDSRPMRTTLRLLLEASSGVEVLEAADGIEALRVLEDGPVDLLICDLEMPKLDGRKLIKILGDRAKSPDVIVISGTARVEPSQSGASLAAPVVGWLEKPFDTDELLALVDSRIAAQTAS